MPQGPPPHDYADYFALLAGATRRIVTNAADPARKAVYHPVAACFKADVVGWITPNAIGGGYDSYSRLLQPYLE